MPLTTIVQTIAALAFAGISTTIIWFAERSRPDTAGDSVWGDVMEVPDAAKIAGGRRSAAPGFEGHVWGHDRGGF